LLTRLLLYRLGVHPAVDAEAQRTGTEHNEAAERDQHCCHVSSSSNLRNGPLPVREPLSGPCRCVATYIICQSPGNFITG